MAAIRLPPVIGHRGAAALAPENTIAGLRAARDAGARWVEFDVRLSRDGVCVLAHDAGFRRTAARSLRISRASLAEIQALDVGAWFAPRFAGEAVPTLGEALDFLAENAMGANVELKRCGRRNGGLARAVVAELRRCGAASIPVLVSSFSPALLARVRALESRLPLGLLLRRRRRRDWRRTAAALGCTSIHCADDGLTRETVGQFRQPGYAVVVFTVNTPERARELFAWGVDAVISSRPDLLIKAAPGAAPTHG